MIRALGLTIGLLIVASSVTSAQAPPATLREMLDGAIEQFTVFAGEEEKEPAKTVVALRWANNARGSEDGMTLLYVHHGRPLAAACIYPWNGRVIHDFESLTTDRIVARRGDQTVWRPQTGGVEFANVPDAPAPAATAAQRLRQMKSIAAEFESTMLGWKADSTDREELRLLTKPLYRYEPAKETGLLDGAVFGFAMGTDPESLLLLQAIGDKEDAKWQFAFARRTSGELEGRYREKVVWNAARYPKEGNPLSPHFGIGTPIPAELLLKPAE